MLMPFAHSDVGLERITLAHGLAHAAFSSRRPWVSEGVAHFMQALEREQLAGRKAALDYMGLHRAAFVAAEEPAGTAKGNDSARQPLISTFDETFYRSKAMYVWWMLRDMIGDPALRRALRGYDSARDNDPRYIEGLITAESKRDLSWFFDDWVHQDRGLPEFHVMSAFARKTDKGSYLLTVAIENTGTAGAEVPFTVTYGGGEIEQRLEIRGKSSSTTRVEVPGAPEEIVVNDGSVPESDLSNNHFKVVAQ
jgi:aminopeptidase N